MYIQTMCYFLKLIILIKLRELFRTINYKGTRLSNKRYYVGIFMTIVVIIVIFFNDLIFWNHEPRAMKKLYNSPKVLDWL